MKFHRFVLAVLAATLMFTWFSSPESGAFGRRAVMGPNHGYGYGYGYPYGAMPYMGYGYGPAVPYFNPYVGSLPGYGVLPPPLATWEMMYKNQGAGGRPVDPNQLVDSLDYVPRFRKTLGPAIPNMRSPEDRDVDLKRARFEIAVPTANAIVLFDGVKTTQTGMNRTYITPALTEDKLYSSTIEVQWADEAGTKITRRRTFEYVAGETLRHRFAE